MQVVYLHNRNLGENWLFEVHDETMETVGTGMRTISANRVCKYGLYYRSR